MRPIRVTVASQASSAPVPLDHYQGPFNVGIAVVLSAGASLTYSVEHTFDDVFAKDFTPSSANWVDHPSLTAQNATKDSNIAYPVRGIRLNVTAGTGTTRLTIIQAGGGGLS